MKKEKCVDDSNSERWGRFFPGYETYVTSSLFVDGRPLNPNPNSEVPNKWGEGLNKRVNEWGWRAGLENYVKYNKQVGLE